MVYTKTGRFYVADSPFDMECVAHSLGQLARFNGNGSFFYSVAEHSVLVSLLMEELKLGDPLEGLLHDGTESVLSDVPSPIKSLLPDWCKLETLLDKRLRRQYDLPLEKTAGCHHADQLALFIEAYQLVTDKGVSIKDSLQVRPQALTLRNQGWMIRGLEWHHASEVFLSRFSRLKR
jgi:hypothetical protein